MIELAVQKEIQQNINIKEKIFSMINEELLDIGFNPNQIGYTYLAEAIYMYLSTPINNDIISVIYNTLAEKYKRIPLSVNRSITKAIYDVWNTTAINKYNYTLQSTSVTADYMPQNAELIATIAENIIIRTRTEKIL